ncbi:DUF3800 domain-containing protein [Actinomycetospora sp. OC33-EN08]|uniref:DUF3800 domain-containing protein n=1 Tax=Actinomycetospora aurantiaca TaxID=3129233 RepID=A0ABU8MR26_9PSEU
MDESFHEHPSEGFYVLAAAIFTGPDPEHARAAMLGLRAARATAKLHWNEMDADQRRTATATVAGLDGVHVVVVGAPVPPRRQERARRLTLRRLTYELHGMGVTRIVIESRQQVLDRRDVTLVTATRNDLPKGTRLRVDHQRGADEPLLWVADIVAGAVRAGRHGVDDHRELLGALVEIIDVPC